MVHENYDIPLCQHRLLPRPFPATAAKGGAKTVVPYLQGLYTSRAGAYGEALKQFVAGYREGLKEGMHKADELKDKQ